MATSSAREEGSGFLSQILTDVGMEGMLWGEVLMASQDRRMDQKTAVGHRSESLGSSASHPQHGCVSEIQVLCTFIPAGLPGEAGASHQWL